MILLASSLTACERSANDQRSADKEDVVDQQVTEAFATLNYSPEPVVHHDSFGRVKVEASTAWSPDGRLIIRAIFTPDDAGYHLYSSKIPITGVDGIGRPTLIEVSGSDLIQEVGPLVSTEKPFKQLDETLNITLSVYPDGPVTLYLPVRFKVVPDAPTQVPVKLTYMACSKQRCHVPVVGAVEEVTTPAPVASVTEQSTENRMESANEATNR